jgi:uncharacterized damage-inducible protein DinB
LLVPENDDVRKGPNTMTTTTTTPVATLDAERTDFLAQLAASRSALIATTHGLTDEQAGERPTASALCLGGLVKHVASMEDAWMRFVVEGPSAMRYDLPDGVTWADFAAGTAREYPQWAIDHQNEFRMLPGETLAGVVERYEQVAARTEDVVAAVPDLSATHPLPEAPWHEPGAEHSVRRVLMHLIAETAQHAGHADILRESLDGRTSA